MAVNITSIISRFNTRSTWLSLLFLSIFLWTFVHLNFNSEPLTSYNHKSAQISYSHPGDASYPDNEPPSRAVLTHTPEFTELAVSPLKIYIPPEIPADDPLNDIWATPYHTQSQSSEEAPADPEAYYKALSCPVCSNEPKGFDISRCPNIDEFNSRVNGAQKGCPKQPFDISRCPNIATLYDRPQENSPPAPPLADPSSSSSSSSIDASPLLLQDRPLISYVYSESPSSHRNLAFFVNHALHDAADFIFILNGPTTVDEDLLPKGRTNINIFKRPENTCFPLGAHAEILGKEGKDGRKALKDMYERYVLMGSEVRGPFMPRWSGACWSEALLSRVQSKVKLVGAGLSCKKGSTPYLQTGILATDKVGLAVLFSSGNGINECFQTEEDALKGEMTATQAVRDQGFEVEVLDMAFRAESEYRYLECTEDQGRFGGIGSEGGEVDPWEVLFVGADEKGREKDGDGRRKLEMLSKRVGVSGYSSYIACKSSE